MRGCVSVCVCVCLLFLSVVQPVLPLIDQFRAIFFLASVEFSADFAGRLRRCCHIDTDTHARAERNKNTDRNFKLILII